MYLEINSTNEETVINSFRDIAKKLFNDFKIIVNDTYYRLLDIEFYFYADGVFEDIYAHKHAHQLQNGKWYAHGSGLDITFGNETTNYGGILIRAIAEINKNAAKEDFFIKREINGQLCEIHGPLNVKTEIFSKFNDAFNTEPFNFCLADISKDRQGALMFEPTYIIETERIGLNVSKDVSEGARFFNGKFRFVIFPHLKLKEKTKIAHHMKEQFTSLNIAEINKILGSKFL